MQFKPRMNTDERGRCGNLRDTVPFFRLRPFVRKPRARSQVSCKLPLIDQIPYLLSSYNFRAGAASLAVDN